MGHRLRDGARRRRQRGRDLGARRTTSPRRSRSATRTRPTTRGSRCLPPSRPPPTPVPRSPVRRSSSWRCRRSRCGPTSARGRSTCADGAVLVSLMKGIELGTTLRMSEVIAEVAGDARGPGRRRVRAEPGPRDRVARSRPRPSSRARTRRRPSGCQDACNTAYFRPYTNDRRRRHGARRRGQERHRAGQRHGRRHGVRRQHAVLADHPRARRDDPPRDRAGRRPAHVPRARRASATWSPPASRRCRATGPSASTSARGCRSPRPPR